MSAAGSFRVIRVDRPPLEGGDRILDESRLVQGVGMDSDLHVVFLGDAQAVSMAAGVEPQSSCSFSPTAPALTC